MNKPPPCSAMGRQCTALRVTLRIGSLDEGNTSLDHEATWLLGHTENITFLELWEDEGELYTEAVLHVPCRYLQQAGNGAQCSAYDYRADLPAPRRRPQPRQLGSDRFALVDRRRLTTRRIPAPPPVAPASRSLPVVSLPAVSANPCAGAPCRTADNRRGAACCRDLQVEIMCTRTQRVLESLVRARQSPYLCKVTRDGDFSIEAEMISACGYLEPGSVSCTLHGRLRSDGRPAKPDLCSEWPPKDKGLHPGCVFAKRPRLARR
ncbi:MAG: hypothetical protein ABI637_02675 [Gemmatimonadota bacterium]